MAKFLETVRANLNGMKKRSAWDRGVDAYAQGLVDDLEEWTEGGYIDQADIQSRRLEKILLNGADDWKHYSWSGCSLCYNGQIAERLCSPSELKRSHGGALQPSQREHWLDVQARALVQAYLRVKMAVDTAKEAQA